VLLVVFVTQELSGTGGRSTRPDRSSGDERQTRILARVAWKGLASGGVSCAEFNNVFRTLSRNWHRFTTQPLVGPISNA